MTTQEIILNKGQDYLSQEQKDSLINTGGWPDNRYFINNNIGLKLNKYLNVEIHPMPKPPNPRTIQSTLTSAQKEEIMINL